MLHTNLTLDVSCQKVTDSRLAYIRRCIERDPRFTDLTTLHLFDNRITSNGMQYVCQMNPSAVTTIWLGHNRIQDSGVATLVSVQWPHLTRLFLDDNYIGNEGAQMLTALSSVRRLGLHTNCLTETGIRHLQRRSYEVLWVHSQRPSGCRRTHTLC